MGFICLTMCMSDLLLLFEVVFNCEHTLISKWHIYIQYIALYTNFRLFSEEFID